MNRLNKLILSHISVSLLYIVSFVLLYSRPVSLIPLHIATICALYFTAFYFSRIFKSQFKIISTGLFTILSGTIILVYIADSLSNSLWNDNISVQFVLAFLSDLDILLEDIPLALPVLIILIVSIYLAVFWLYNRFAIYLHEYDHELNHAELRPYILISLILPVMFYLSFKPTAPGIWDGEPISNLAVKTNTLSHLHSSGDTLDFNSSKSQSINHKLQNIILVHADSLRADHMSSYGYHRKTSPFMDSLIEKGAVKIDTGLSICSESICGILSALGSREMKDIDPDTPLLQTYLKSSGYRVLFSGSGKLSWENLDSIIWHDIDYFERADLDENYSINDDTKILSTLSKVSDYSGVPTFFFLHYMSSHQTGRHFKQYNKYKPSKKNLLTYIFPSFDDPQVLINAYDNHVVQMDDMLAKSIKILDDKGYMDNSIIIIYGDHGEALNEHGYYGHYKNLYQEEILVPMIFSTTKDHVFSETGYATLDDIVPTVLDMLNLAIPEDINGVSLLKEQVERITFHDSRTGIYAVVQRKNENIFKLLYDSSSKTTQLYDLNNDPLEKNDMTKILSGKARDLLGELKIYFELI